MPVYTVYYSKYDNIWHCYGDLSETERCYGGKYWFKNGKCHRDNNLPAMKYSNGDKCWYKSGECHRNGDLPAIEYSNGGKVWCKNGKLHRDGDLPAEECANGNKQWCKNGIKYYPIIQLIAINIIKIKIMKMGDKWWYQCRYN